MKLSPLEPILRRWLGSLMFADACGAAPTARAESACVIIRVPAGQSLPATLPASLQ